jgi:hypothetical protein
MENGKKEPCQNCHTLWKSDQLKDGYCPACLFDVPSESGGENG